MENQMEHSDIFEYISIFLPSVIMIYILIFIITSIIINVNYFEKAIH